MLSVTQNKEDADGGNDVERREQRRGRRQIKFPRGKYGEGRKEDREKWEGSDKAGRAASSELW